MSIDNIPHTPSAVPTHLSADAGGGELVVTGPSPRLSWHPPLGAGLAQRYEVEASIEGEAPVRAVVRGHHLVPWPWAPLSGARRVTWRVRVAAADSLPDAAGPGPGEDADFSATHRFESGLPDGEWDAHWISPASAVVASTPRQDVDGRRPAARLGVTFTVPGDVVSARLYSTALGLYEAFVNGKRAGEAELSPGSTSYDLTLHAQVSDVTADVYPGENRLEIELSDGWYRGQVGAFRASAGWGERTAARAVLRVELADGRRLDVPTDASWRARRSLIVGAGLMDGQSVDLAADPGDWTPVEVNAVTAPAVSYSPAPPVRVVRTRPADVVQLGEGVWIADAGQNASGWLRLNDVGPFGTRTVIDYGEHLGTDGDLDTTHLNSSRPGEPQKVFVQRDEVLSAGDGSAFEPRHTVHGFRYARITRTAPDGAAPELDPGSVEARIVYTDFQRTGSFESADPRLNTLHALAERSFLSNAVDIPTDCPTRERLGWTGDYQVFAPMAARLFDVRGFSDKWLGSVRDDQFADGRIANFSPDGRRLKTHPEDQFAMMTGSSGWGDAIVLVPWTMYEEYGDTRVLRENWDAMVAWNAWAANVARTRRHPSRVKRSAEPAPHEAYLWDGSFHWGEWIEPKAKREDGTPIDPVQENPAAWFGADKGEVGTAFLYRTTALLSRIAGVLRFGAEAERYGAEADRVLDAWRTEFLLPGGRTVGDTQASYVRALSFGLIPEELRGCAAARLVELIEAAGNHLGTGFLSTGDLLSVLAEVGHPQVAEALLFSTGSPSWMNMVDHGATTIWEDWDGVDDAGSAHESLNHYSKGAAMRYLHTHVLGLRQAPGSVAWERAVVDPVPPTGLQWARGAHTTPQGEIRVQWRRQGDSLGLVVSVPAGTVVSVPGVHGGTAVEFGEGTHSVTLSRMTPDSLRPSA